MAEIELSILGRPCLDRRIDNAETLIREVAAWEEERNASQTKVHWRFTTADARIKLGKALPVIRWLTEHYVVAGESDTGAVEGALRVKSVCTIRDVTRKPPTPIPTIPGWPANA